MAISSRVHVNGRNKYAATFHMIGDDEAAVVKIDRSTLLPPGGGAASATTPQIRIDEITWSVQSADSTADGLSAVLIEFDDATDEVIAYCGAGDGYKDFRDVGGYTMAGTPGAVADGDIIFTTIGTVAANDTYDITLKCTIKD